MGDEGHSNWRWPTHDELASIMVGAGATSDPPQECIGGLRCIDGAFSGMATAEALLDQVDPDPPPI